MSSLVLGLGAFAMATLGAAGVAVFVQTVTPSAASAASAADTAVVVTYAVLTFILGLLILNFCGSILLNVVDGAHVCLALDADPGTHCQPAMRDALFVIAKPSGLVQQPGSAPPVIAVASGTPVVGQPVHPQGAPPPTAPPPVA